ncbi:PREDICTED: L10-interacting MYB domain-containing protein-like [Lupinus angustifolius]|nr:PREDICTED: L10-interacting MYB domain-containing protein-like [Lupinus angustifolius]
MSDNEVRRLRQERNFNNRPTDIENGDEDGNANPSNANEGRIRWTLPMDHYFIDLLLEQMNLGNKVGNTYTPQVWNAIVKSFNEQFKTHYGKQNLRNHFKHLKRQYIVVSNLLQLKEFTWDETKEMVVGEDHVWDAYIKENHEARSIRTKGLHGYSKLCAILAEESSETRHSSSSQNIDHLNVETQILSTEGIEKEVEQQNYGFTFFDEQNHDIQDIFSYLELEMGEVEWTEAMEVYFIELMVEQVNINSGNINNSGCSFSEEAWTHMIEAFSTRMGYQYHKHFLEEQFMCLMYRHQNMTDLLNHTGLAFDQTLQITLATTQVWEAQLQNNQEALSSKLKSLRVFHDLCKIFGNKLTEVTASDIMQQLHIMDGANNINTINMNMNETSRSSEISQNDKKRANMMASSSEADWVKKKKKMESFESAVNALLELKDMDEDVVMEACDLLEDDKKAMTFLALDVSMRKKWLLKKLRP